MAKLKAFLMSLVLLYVIYAIVRDGLTSSLAILLGLLVFAGIGQLWQHSSWRKKMKEQHKK